MTTEQTFENLRDSTTGVVRCPQCLATFLELDECEIIDGYIYCPWCGRVL